MSENKAKQLLGPLQALLAENERLDKRESPVSDRLSAQELRVLRTVGQERCCVMSRISRAVCLSLSSVTGLIDRLVEKKLVRRDRSAEDRRQVEVALTDEGRELHAAALQAHERFAGRVLSALSAAEQDELIALLRKVESRIKEEPA